MVRVLKGMQVYLLMPRSPAGPGIFLKASSNWSLSNEGVGWEEGGRQQGQTGTEQGARAHPRRMFSLVLRTLYGTSAANGLISCSILQVGRVGEKHIFLLRLVLSGFCHLLGVGC